MSREVECEGSPRDLGRDQGRACAEVLRGRLAALGPGARLRLRLAGLRGSEGLRRELSRHFPRQAEMLAGISAAAGVPEAWLAALLEREVDGSPGEIAAAAGAATSPSGALVARSLGGEWIVRRSRPEGAFRSVEVTRPWLAHPLLGVNEAGLAVAVVAPDPPPLASVELHGSSAELHRSSRPLRGRFAALPAGARSPLASGSLRGRLAALPAGARSPLASGSLRGRFAALPAAPLALDCLQRFATLEACLDWCASRPGERPACLLFADAAGEVAGIEVAPGRRRVLPSAEGWLAAGGSPGAREAVGKALRERGGLVRDPPSQAGALAFADPAARSLRIGNSRHGL